MYIKVEILRDVKHCGGGVESMPLLDISSDDVFLPSASTSEKLHRDFTADDDNVDELFHSFQQRQKEFENEIRKSAEELKNNSSKIMESFDASLELSQVENAANSTTVSPVLSPTSPTSTISPIEISPRLISPYSDSPVVVADGLASLSDFQTPDIGNIWCTDRHPLFFKNIEIRGRIPLHTENPI